MQLDPLASLIPALTATLSMLVFFMVPQPTRAEEPMPALTREQASGFARLALKGLGKEYPNKPEHVMAGPDDVKGPKALHPAFYGSYDWHSSVHGHWMLARLLRLFPDLPEGTEIRAVLAEHLTAENLKAEAELLRPQGEQAVRAALRLGLAAEARRGIPAAGTTRTAKRWSQNLRPLADVVVARYVEFFPKQTYPIRTGVHPNTAFGLAFAHDYARAVDDTRLRELVEERARAYFGDDSDAPARWEPSGADFFSPSLVEADLMRRVLPAGGVPGLVRRGSCRGPPGASRRRCSRPPP